MDLWVLVVMGPMGVLGGSCDDDGFLEMQELCQYSKNFVLSRLLPASPLAGSCLVSRTNSKKIVRARNT